MANARTAADLLDLTLDRCGEMTDGTSSYEAAALRYMNSVYRAILAGGNEFDVDCGEPWIWAQATSPYLLKLQAPISTGTITLTSGSTTGAFSSAPASSLAGWFIKPSAGKDWYQIAAHGALSTSFTLDQAYIEASVSAGTYIVVKTDYSIGTAITRLVGPMMCYRDSVTVQGDPERGQIFEIDVNSMSRDYPRMLINQSVPEKYCVIGYDTDGLSTIRFSSYVAEAMRVEVPYIAVQADLTDSSGSIPLLPLGFRELLAYGASYYIMLDKSDNRSEATFQLARAKLQALISHNRKSLSLGGNGFGKLIPRMAGLRRRAFRTGVG